GDPALITITKLNASGSRVEITFKPQTTRLIGIEQRTSDLFIVGAFVSNGAYTSAPGFITVANLANQIQTPSANSMLMTFTSVPDPNFKNGRGWISDEYFYDVNGDIKSFTRKAYAPTVEFNGDGLLILTKDAAGNALTVGEVNYTVGAGSYVPMAWAAKYTDCRATSTLKTASYTATRGSILRVPFAFGPGQVSVIQK
ncbi:MAG: hypothetical protein V4692_15200, partial [Bdellovibrionota bacterium]